MYIYIYIYACRFSIFAAISSESRITGTFIDIYMITYKRIDIHI